MKDLRSSGDTLTFVRYKIRHNSKPRVIPFAPTQQSDESPEVPVNRQRLSVSFRLAEKNAHFLPTQTPELECRLQECSLPSISKFSQKCSFPTILDLL